MYIAIRKMTTSVNKLIKLIIFPQFLPQKKPININDFLGFFICFILAFYFVNIVFARGIDRVQNFV